MTTIVAAGDGDLTLTELESAIRSKEAESYQLKSIIINGKQNQVIFDELELGTFPPDIVLSLDNDQDDKKLVLGAVMALVKGRAVPIFLYR